MRIRIQHPFALSAGVLIALFLDGTGIIQCSLLAILLHETGHTLLYVLLLRRRPVMRIGFGGISLRWNTVGISVQQQTAILLAGPLVNLLTGLFCMAVCRWSFRISVMIFGGANVLLGAFNLLPLGFLDGGRLLAVLLAEFISFEHSEQILRICEYFGLVSITGFLLFFTTDWSVRIALLLFLGYYCSKSFCAKN